MRIFRVQQQPDSKALYDMLEAMDGVAVRPDSAQSLGEFELAYHLAKKAFADKKNIARKMRYEFLLWLAGKTDIKSAMALTAPRDKEGFFLVVFSDKKVMLELLPLRLRKKAEPLALERISLSRVKS